MGTHVIESVAAVRDAVDLLRWRVRVSTDFFGTWQDQAFAFNWDGDAAFYREIPGGQGLRI